MKFMANLGDHMSSLAGAVEPVAGDGSTHWLSSSASLGLAPRLQVITPRS